MPAFHLWLVLGALLVVQTMRIDAFALCKTSASTDNCPHGTVTDFCGNVVCAKGPGDRCGGPSHVHGKCGEGMHCKCEVCSGCSVETLECHFAKATCF